MLGLFVTAVQPRENEHTILKGENRAVLKGLNQGSGFCFLLKGSNFSSYSVHRAACHEDPQQVIHNSEHASGSFELTEAFLFAQGLI